MHCYACNILLDSPSLDRPTNRYYCSVCFEPTTQVMLSIEDAKMAQELNSVVNPHQDNYSILGIVDILNRDGWADVSESDRDIEEILYGVIENDYYSQQQEEEDYA